MVQTMRSEPIDEIFRRQEQVKNHLDNAVEAEDYQAVGMQFNVYSP